MFDQDDESIATSMRDRLIALDRERPWPAEVYQGLGQIIQDVIFLVSLIRTEFLDEAILHLQELVCSFIYTTWEGAADAIRASNVLTKNSIQTNTSPIYGISMIYFRCGVRCADN